MEFNKFFRELFGLFIIFWAIFLLLSLLSFDANDPSFNVVKSGAVEIKNKAGLFGSYTAGFLHDFFGVGSIFWPFVFAFLGAAYLSSKFTMHWWRWLGIFLLTLCILTVSAAVDMSIGDLNGGGMIGKTLYLKSNYYFSPVGSSLIWLFIALIGLQLAFNFSWFTISNKFWHWLSAATKNKWQMPALKDACKKINLQPIIKLCTNIDKNNLKQLVNRILEKRPTIGKMPALISSPDISTVNDTELLMQAGKALSDKAVEFKNISIDEQNKIHTATQITNPEIQTRMDYSSIDFNDTETALPADPENEDFIEDTAIAAQDEAFLLDGIEYEDEDIINTELKHAKDPDEELILPPLNLLIPPTPQPASNQENRQQKGFALMRCFEDFDIKGELVKITPGPVVTMYEMRPERGIRVSKIATLGDDLSLALKAVAVRIQAPIPGSDTIGIEIPNDHREIVNFRELAESDEFTKSRGALTIILGKDIEGRPYMADLAKMPHLLVAGATGAGKSVCLNSILISLLYQFKPKDLRLLLIDPKRIEMAVYADLPHLVHPVVTEMDDAKKALEWAVHEMDRRYQALERLAARNMAAYNQKLAAMGDNRPEEYADLEHLPYLVIIIDELADLMVQAAREVQTSIARLAALARAAGIHMILATQRPSVDVVTGVIKANILNRISFQVTNRHDSRTILDQSGGESLLGKGDMLYKLSGGRLLRLHGPFLSDEEVQAVANYWKEQKAPDYGVDFTQWSPDSATTSGDESDNGTDSLYSEVRSFTLNRKSISISNLQIQFRIGFCRASRLIDQLEKEGLISAADGSKPRVVLK